MVWALDDWLKDHIPLSCLMYVMNLFKLLTHMYLCR